MARIQRLHLRDVGPAIALREDFTSGNMTGRTTGGGLMTATSPTGLLVGPDLDAWVADRMSARYVVRSYQTPIAWHVEDSTSGRWYVVRGLFKGSSARHVAAIPPSVHLERG